MRVRISPSAQEVLVERAKKWTDEQLTKAVSSAHSVAKVCRLLGLAAAGGNYETINRSMQRLGLEFSSERPSGQAWRKGNNIPVVPKLTLNQVLIRGRTCSSYHLKNRLIIEGIFDRRCYSCGLTNWLDQLIPLELEHIDGDRSNNLLENLTLLCPNCHALTPTYRGKNMQKASRV